MDENTLENIVLPTLTKHKSIPLAYMGKPTLMPVSYTHLDVYKRQVFLLLVFFQIRVQHCPILRAVLDYCDVVHENSPFESK